MKSVFKFLKKEAVLTISWILAIGSAFFVHPDKRYIDYIDFRSLGILWSLMIVMKAFSDYGIFSLIGNRLLLLTKKIWQLCAVLVGLCFFTSMLITNDVALITFVPFSILMLKACKRQDLFIPVIVLQTVAANLGSMLTPVGNPQNLYMYSLMKSSLPEFLKLLLPYTAASFLLLTVSLLFIKGKNELCTVETEKSENQKINLTKVLVFTVLFILAVLTVVRLVHFYFLLCAVLAGCLLVNRKIIFKVDYALLFTFVGFFIFTGNMGRLSFINEALQKVVGGNETFIGIAVSQVISNVPAALLLSGFARDLPSLTLGVDLGGLGTLIASMASLISYKFYAATENSKKGRYLLVFTAVNVIYLAALTGLYILQTV